MDEISSREANAPEELLKDLVANWQDGRIKLHLIRKALNFRLAHKELFAAGEYIPLEVVGQRPDSIVAFGRHRRKDWLMVAVPRLVAGTFRRRKSLLHRANWPALKVILPRKCPLRWRNIFTSSSVSARPGRDGQIELPLSGMLDKFPCVLLEPEAEKSPAR